MYMYFHFQVGKYERQRDRETGKFEIAVCYAVKFH